MPEARSDSNDNDMAVEEEPPKQSQKVWFSDGNIVLQAQNVQFKVHKSVLAKHSSVFADLFEMPHTNGDEQTADGCPIVQLHDSADDIKHMTLTLYGDKAYNNVSGGLPMPVVAAMVRMGRKYDIDHIKLEGLSRLKKLFPESLDDWDRLRTSGITPEHELQGLLDLTIEAINLAHEDHDMWLDNHPAVPAAALGPCFDGRDELYRTQWERVYAWLDGVGAYPGCLHQAECLASGRVLMSRIWKHPNLWCTFHDWGRVVEEHDHLVKILCSSCASQAENSQNAGRVKLWDNLPHLFGLGSWNELKDFES
ncbi:hypothetical protein D9611_007304 [Ephemerocybe angulata]|uniref:BTB domain-containing protein n=1 Tax=Ephemerocybe angulata TaxID=980116 RepID=A0A8H5FKW2_9AGAR|nr:hypothetical protein D9611_007304 [Tulosesus angulatus]